MTTCLLEQCCSFVRACQRRAARPLRGALRAGPQKASPEKKATPKCEAVSTSPLTACPPLVPQRLMHRRADRPTHIHAVGLALSLTAIPSLSPRLDPSHHGLVPHDAVLRVQAVVVLAGQIQHLARHAAPLQCGEGGDALPSAHAKCYVTTRELDRKRRIRTTPRVPASSHGMDTSDSTRRKSFAP
jgi:hypothetical protein